VIVEVSWFDEAGVRVTTSDRHPGYRRLLAKQAAEAESRRLKKIEVDRVDLVERGANPGARVQLVKTEDEAAAAAKQDRLAEITAENEKLRKRLAKLEKAQAESAAASEGRAAGVTPSATPALPKDEPGVVRPTLDGGHGVSDAGRYNPVPGDQLGELADKLDRMVRRGDLTSAAASEMFTRQRLRLAAPADSLTKAAGANLPSDEELDEHAAALMDLAARSGKPLTRDEARAHLNQVMKDVSSAPGIDIEGPLVEYAYAKLNVSRPINELELRKELRRRERAVTPLTKGQGLLIGARVMKGLSQAQVSRETGISKTTISMIESGQSPVSGTVALRLAEAYGLEGADALQWCREVSRPKPEG